MVAAILRLALLAAALAPVCARAAADCAFERISPHVWVLHGSDATACPRGPDRPATNVGAVVTDAGVVLIDPGGSAPITGLVLDRLAAVTAKPVVAVIDTHIHGPYWLGNAAVRARYPGVPIIAHARMIERLQDGEARLWAETLGAASPGAVAVPDRPVVGGATLTVGNLRLLLHAPGHAHTDHDLLVEIPDDRVLFLGGLVVEPELPSQGVPGDADFRGQIRAIRAAMARPADLFVPGRGRTGGKALPRRAWTFLEALYQGVSRYYDAGLPDFEIAERLRKELSPFRDHHDFRALGRVVSYIYLQVEDENF